MAKSRFEGSEFTKLIEANGEIARLRTQLERANRIIGWMCPYIGSMCPPDGGIADFNEHTCDNRIPSPGKETKGAPLRQRR
jgi:hypothetical protein